MKNSKAFYRSALATAIVMALSAPAFATDSTVSTDPVTLNTEKTTLDQDVVINGDNKITAVTIETSDSDKDLNVTFGGHDITAASTVNQDFVEGVKVSGNKNVVINATDSTITAQGEGTYVRLQWSLIQLAMLLLMAVISLQKMKKVVRQGYLWKRPREII